MRLVHKATGNEVKVGDIVMQHGHKMAVSSWERPRSLASSGRIYVCAPHQLSKANTLSQGFYPGVYDCEWIEREDREAADRENPIRIVRKAN